MTKLGIIGATGQLGGATLDGLLGQNTPPGDIVAIGRSVDKLRDYEARGVVVRRADYDDISTMQSAFAGLQRLLLVPSIVKPGPRALQYDNAVGAARAAGVKHLLHYSIVGTALDNPFLVNPFLVFAESLLRTSGMAWTILRNPLYAEPIVEWLPAIREMKTIPYPTGTGRCAYTTRHDMGRAGAAVLAGEGHEGKIYNLTGPELMTTADLCDVIRKVTGDPVKDSAATEQDYIDRCRAEGEPEVMIGFLTSLYHAIREGFLDVESNDIERLTGRAPETFESLLRRSS